jgi:hypothetical protein
MRILLADDLVTLSLFQQLGMAFLQTFGRLSAQVFEGRWPLGAIHFTFTALRTFRTRAVLVSAMRSSLLGFPSATVCAWFGLRPGQSWTKYSHFASYREVRV